MSKVDSTATVGFIASNLKYYIVYPVGLRLMCFQIHLLFFPALLKKHCLLFFFNSHTVPIILIIFFLPLLLQIIAGDNRNNTYILPAQNEAHHHRHNYNPNNLNYLFIKVHQNLEKHIQNLAINNCG